MAETETGVILKTGRDKAIRNHHHWIFSGAVERLPEACDGAILPVYSHDGKLLGHGYFNSKTQISGRMLSFGDEDPFEALRRSLRSAHELRKSLPEGGGASCFRLINGEGDGIPGLIVDYYDGILVLQISTLGIEALKDFLLDALTDLLQPSCIYEKSNLPSRHQEGLPNAEGVLRGHMPGEITVSESGLHYCVDIAGGQKTGLFLDQRENRNLVRSFSRGRSVMNCFAYTGAFSVCAAAGGAVSVDSVDISHGALKLARKNCELNFPGGPFAYHAADVFQLLRSWEKQSDFIILDPPAFAKKKNDIIKACRGYKDINRIAMEKLPPGGLLLTCSCSYHVDEPLFRKVLFEAAIEAGRNVRIIQKHRQACDHPVNVYHPEGEYLKSFLCYVE